MWAVETARKGPLPGLLSRGNIVEEVVAVPCGLMHSNAFPEHGASASNLPVAFCVPPKININAGAYAVTKRHRSALEQLRELRRLHSPVAPKWSLLSPEEHAEEFPQSVPTPTALRKKKKKKTNVSEYGK